jgi:hypothetical protein
MAKASPRTTATEIITLLRDSISDLPLPEIWSIVVDEIRAKSRGDLDAVLELNSSDDVTEQLVSV